MRLVKHILSTAAVMAIAVSPAFAVTLNEIVCNDISTDDREFAELCGQPNESLDGLTLVIIEGESTGWGTIDKAIDLTGYVIPADGFFVIGDAAVSPDLEVAANWIENGAETVLLVRDFTGTLGQDIDAENDCVADVSIGTIVDGVAMIGGTSTDCAYYGVPVLGPDGTYDPAGVARCADCDGPWGIICLNGTEPTPTGTACAVPDYIVEFATPGDANCPGTPVELKTWGGIKLLND